jgi:hypothetical protein
MHIHSQTNDVNIGSFVAAHSGEDSLIHLTRKTLLTITRMMMTNDEYDDDDNDDDVADDTT